MQKILRFLACLAVKKINIMTEKNDQKYSVSPLGEKFPIPSYEDFKKELERVETLVDKARKEGKEIVVVMGVGFVGAVMAAIVADTKDENGKPSKFVIGCQRPSARSYWKIPVLNRGESPVKAEDPEVEKIIKRSVIEYKTLIATYSNTCLKFADCVVVDVQCDYTKNDLGKMKTGDADMAALEATMKTIGEYIQPECLVLIETTVAPGTTEFVAWPILKKAFSKRGIESTPLLAHSFERVMPGKEYVSSIRDFWRVCAGCDDEARTRVEKFLHEVLNTKDFGIPQNRQRVFFVGIRKDSKQCFCWPEEFELKLKLKDLLEKNVNEKYFLSDEQLNKIFLKVKKHKAKKSQSFV